jgi:hypothetical protein
MEELYCKQVKVISVFFLEDSKDSKIVKEIVEVKK